MLSRAAFTHTGMCHTGTHMHTGDRTRANVLMIHILLGNLMGEIRAGNPTEEQIVAFARAQRDEQWCCPLQINAQDVIRDRDW